MSLSNLIDQNGRKFLFPKHPIAGGILTFSPWRLALAMSLVGATVLFIPAYFLNLLSIPGALAGRPSENVGIFYRPNWSVSYTITLPLIFAFIALVCRTFKGGIGQLGSHQIIIAAKKGRNLERDIAYFLRRWDRRMFWIAAGVVILITVIDGWHNFNGYFTLFTNHKAFTSFDEKDWMNAATYLHQPTLAANLIFYLVALLLQGLVIFGAFYFLFQYWLATDSLASLIIDSKRYEFKPYIDDVDKCLGLRPIGNTFSFFLLLSTIFQLYAVYHRVQILLPAMKIDSWWSYLLQIYDAYKDRSIHELVRLSGFGSLNPGMILIFIFMPIPLAAISWWPLIKLRRFVSRRRNQMIDDHRMLSQKAQEAADFATAERLRQQITRLQESCVWPNGFKIGWGFFFLLIGLIAGTIAPPILVLVVVSGLGAKLVQRLFKRDEK